MAIQDTELELLVKKIRGYFIHPNDSDILRVQHPFMQIETTEIVKAALKCYYNSLRGDSNAN